MNANEEGSCLPSEVLHFGDRNREHELPKSASRIRISRKVCRTEGLGLPMTARAPQWERAPFRGIERCILLEVSTPCRARVSNSAILNWALIQDSTTSASPLQ